MGTLTKPIWLLTQIPCPLIEGTVESVCLLFFYAFVSNYLLSFVPNCATAKQEQILPTNYDLCFSARDRLTDRFRPFGACEGPHAPVHSKLLPLQERRVALLEDK